MKFDGSLKIFRKQELGCQSNHALSFCFKWEHWKPTLKKKLPRKVRSKIFQHIFVCKIKKNQSEVKVVLHKMERWELWCVSYQAFCAFQVPHCIHFSARSIILKSYSNHSDRAFLLSLLRKQKKQIIGGKLADYFYNLQGSKEVKATTWSRYQKLSFKGHKESTQPSPRTLVQNKSPTLLSFLCCTIWCNNPQNCFSEKYYFYWLKSLLGLDILRLLPNDRNLRCLPGIS